MTQATAKDFDLVLRENDRFFWKLPNHGIAVWGDGLTWEFDGHPRKRKYSEISTVHLSSGHIARHGVFYSCRITFNDGSFVAANSATPMGLPDDEKTGVYGDFVRALHEQLRKSGNTNIAFRAGMTPGKHRFAIATLIVAGLLFVALPVGIFVFLETSWHVLGLMGAGVALVWPVWRQVQTNAPHDYAADDLPVDLVP